MARPDAKKLQPIIIKRIKKGGHAAHGGAWKIAYADFVTAMMAFFLLMWLLGSTTEGDKKGIADYFAAAEGGAAGRRRARATPRTWSRAAAGPDALRAARCKNGDVEASASTINLRR
jgi:chemotaxis protein MotB